MTDDRKPRQFYIADDYDNGLHVEDKPTEGFDIKVIELDPTLQLMKELGEALKENGLSHDFDCGISVNGRHECSCGYLKSKEVLEKYRNFLEGIEK